MSFVNTINSILSASLSSNKNTIFLKIKPETDTGKLIKFCNIKIGQMSFSLLSCFKEANKNELHLLELLELAKKKQEIALGFSSTISSKKIFIFDVKRMVRGRHIDLIEK